MFAKDFSDRINRIILLRCIAIIFIITVLPFFRGSAKPLAGCEAGSRPPPYSFIALESYLL